MIHTERLAAPLRVAFAAPLVLALTAPGARAQVTPDEPARVELGLEASVLVDHPRQFQSGWCGADRAAGIGARADYRVARAVAVEGGLILAGAYGTQLCAALPPTPIGVPVQRTTYRDEVSGSTLFATSLSAVLEPFFDADVSPRAWLGVGRILNKKLGYWHVGGGVRFRFGRHSMVMDVERWTVHIDALREVVVYELDGGVTVQSSEPVEEREQSYLVRVGWRTAVR